VNTESNILAPWFIGSYGENDIFFENLLLELIRDHLSWRHNLHPEDCPIVRNCDTSNPEFSQAIREMKHQLHQLTANLKQTAAINSPQYFGDMSSDLLLPGLIAQLATTLYNPNSLMGDKALGTIDMELQAGRQIARMLGYNTDPKNHPCAWGHITSGGTTANYESLWNARAISFYPLAMKAAAIKLELKLKISIASKQLLTQCNSWQCQNFNVDGVLALQKYCFHQIVDKSGRQAAINFFKEIELHRVEHMGMASFFAEHWDAKQPLVLIPSTAHSSWEKAMKLLGFGSSQILKLDVNSRMRIDVASLERVLNNAEQKKIPILAVVGILGTNEFGSIDPLAEIVQLREHFYSRGLNFYFHIDAAWGGYLCSLFRNDDDSLVSHADIKKTFKRFPSQSIYDAFSVVNKADSVTVNPYKMGYLPFGTGAFISRNREITTLLSKNNLYFSDHGATDIDDHLRQQDEFILEGSISGATACCLTHKVLPLNKNHFGKILSESIHGSEYFYERIQVTIKNLKHQVKMVIPMEPDSLLFCLAINPKNNHCLARMNRFSQRVYKRLHAHTKDSMHDDAYFCSSTSLQHSNLGTEDAQILLKKLGIKKNSFVVNIENPKVQTNSIHVLRHTLLNPWLLSEVNGVNTIDRYCNYLEKVILEVVEKESSNSLVSVNVNAG